MSTALDARLCLLDYLHRSPNGRTVQEILNHLLVHTSWGQSQLASTSKDSGLRTVQVWLKQLRESSEFAGFVEASPDSNDNRRLLYKVSGGPTLNAAMPIEEALLVGLAERHLELVVPEEFRATSLQALFKVAHKTIESYESKLAGDRPAVGHYLQSVAVHPRGQVLRSSASSYANFPLLSSALLHKRCLLADYAGRSRQLHPCAIVVRTPKLYLIAYEDSSTAPTDQDVNTPKAYQCHFLSDVKMLKKPSRTGDFDLQSFVDEEKLEVPLVPAGSKQFNGTIDLVLHIHDGIDASADALIKDLQLHPLEYTQKITLPADESHCILSIDNMVPTEALVNWIAGRLDRIEVMAPNWLRQLIADRIAAVHRRYSA